MPHRARRLGAIAVLLLVALPAPAQDGLETLLAGLGSASPEARQTAREELGKLGEEAASILTKGLESDDLVAALACADLLGEGAWRTARAPLRRVLEDAEGFDDAVNRLAHERLVAGCLLTVVGCDNKQRVVIERTPREHLIRRPNGDEPILVTNHYRELYEKVTGQTRDPEPPFCMRYDALLGFFHDAKANNEVDDAELLYALTDEQVVQDITAQHVIIRPRENSIRLLVPRRLVQDAG